MDSPSKAVWVVSGEKRRVTPLEVRGESPSVSATNELLARAVFADMSQHAELDVPSLLTVDYERGRVYVTHDGVTTYTDRQLLPKFSAPTAREEDETESRVAEQ